MTASPDPHVVVRGLSKTYRIPERRPGFRGAPGSLVSRRYRTVQALEDVGFTLSRGELLGFIGPNGAGKSTTIKILSGILRPDSGTCEVEGRTPCRERTPS